MTFVCHTYDIDIFMLINNAVSEIEQPIIYQSTWKIWHLTHASHSHLLLFHGSINLWFLSVCRVTLPHVVGSHPAVRFDFDSYLCIFLSISIPKHAK